MRKHTVLIIAAFLGVGTLTASAEKRYGPGVSDTEIRIGQTMPYSGPASFYAIEGRAQEAYFRAVNEKRGVNAVEATRRMFIAYSWAVMLVKMLESIGDDLTPEAIVAKATNMKDVSSVALLPGITYNTTPTDYAPIKTLRLQQFNGDL
jgi:hypothetical protein